VVIFQLRVEIANKQRYPV